MRALARCLLVTATLVAADATAQCKLEKIGEWKVQLTGNQPIIEGAINGQKIGILLDTGATSTLITHAATERLKIPRASVRGVRMYGVGGESKVESAHLDEFRLGEAVKKDWTVLVAETRGRNRFDLILGDDFFEKVDLELDLGHRVMRFFLSSGCENANLAYWNPQESIEVPLGTGRKITFNTELNGQSVRTLLDTGASSSVVTITAAMSAGFDPKAPGVMSSGCSSGIGTRTLEGYYSSFDRFAIGRQAIRNATLRVTDLWKNTRQAPTGSIVKRQLDNVPEMLLGMDFLKTHRVFVSRVAGKMFFTHEGGLVFPSSPAMACEGLSQEREASARIAEYNTRIAANGRDVQALLGRSRELIRAGDKDAALRDLDAVIELDPRDVVARNLRAEVLSQRKEYDKAAADYGVAIAGGANNARTYALRALALHRAGQKAKALEDFETALKLDPREPTALYWRGLYRLEAGERFGAQADLEVLEKINPEAAMELRKRLAVP